MADSKPEGNDGASGFFRKVVRFVANPATDWADLDTKQAEPADSSFAKAELKAMVERKRRNDFVRKREFDVLRKIRREGLGAEEVIALRIGPADSEAPRSMPRPQDVEVKAKIDEIENQMQGESDAHWNTGRHPAAFYLATTIQANFAANSGLQATPAEAAPAPPAPAPVAEKPSAEGLGLVDWEPTPAAQAPPPPAEQPANLPTVPASFTNPFEVEVNEIANDDALDEAVIAFANADFEHCERSLSELITPEGPRARHAETWLALFDLYRATGQQQAFENLALDYVQRFGWSAPQWFSIPQLVAEESATRAGSLERSPEHRTVSEGWVSSQRLEIQGVMDLRARTLQMPMPWLLDWSSLRSLEAEACDELTQILRHWARQPIEMRWIGMDQLLTVLADAAPAGVRDADPAYWLLRLEVLRMSDRVDRFEEAAIDYCVTYEVSPPSWERTACTVKIVDSSGDTLAPGAQVTAVSTGFADSRLEEDEGGVRTATVELSGQLVGDIGEVLGRLETRLGDATVVNITCSRLIRLDFVAAGDLLNWVLKRRAEDRLVHFEDAHRLVGFFFNAMGINEHARVKVRNI